VCIYRVTNGNACTADTDYIYSMTVETFVLSLVWRAPPPLVILLLVLPKATFAGLAVVIISLCLARSLLCSCGQAVMAFRKTINNNPVILEENANTL